MTNGKETLEKLLIDKNEMRKNVDQLVEKSLKVFQIEKETGKIVFKNFGVLSDTEKALTVLVGKYFASELELIKDDTLSVSQIAKEIGRPITALSGPIKDLVNKRFVEWLPSRRYRVVYHRMEEVLDYLVNASSKKLKK